MHLPFIAYTLACQMYVTITCTRLKRVLRFISWLYWYRAMMLWKYFKGWTTWAKRVFSKRYTFPCYRASQSRGLTRRLPFTTCIKPSVKRIVISVNLNSVCYILDYYEIKSLRNFTFITFLPTKFFRSMVCTGNVHNYCVTEYWTWRL